MFGLFYSRVLRVKYCTSYFVDLLPITAAACPSVQEKLGILNNGAVYTLYSYQASNADELTFAEGRLVVVLRKGDEMERDWWWGRLQVMSEMDSQIGQFYQALLTRK